LARVSCSATGKRMAWPAPIKPGLSRSIPNSRAARSGILRAVRTGRRRPRSGPADPTDSPAMTPFPFAGARTGQIPVVFPAQVRLICRIDFATCGRDKENDTRGNNENTWRPVERVDLR
jgi:hypothetical protein